MDVGNRMKQRAGEIGDRADSGVALVVGTVSAGFELFMSGALLREQMVKRGRYIAQNLAYNSKYGVLTEDKPLLTQLLEGALSAGTDRSRAGTSDVVGAMIRDAKGAVLAQRGAVIRDLPNTPAASIQERDTARVRERIDHLRKRLYGDKGAREGDPVPLVEQLVSGVRSHIDGRLLRSQIIAL